MIGDSRRAARNAWRLGFDGVEMHAGNSFLFQQLINAGFNRWAERYGGAPIANLLRLLPETADAVVG